MAFEDFVSGFIQALEAYTISVNQLARALELHAEVLRASHKADEMMAKTPAAGSGDGKPEKKSAKAKKSTKKEKAAASPEFDGENAEIKAELQRFMEGARNAGAAANKEFLREVKSILADMGFERASAIPPGDKQDEFLDRVREAHARVVGTEGADQSEPAPDKKAAVKSKKSGGAKEKAVEASQDSPKVVAAKELSSMLTSARERGDVVYRKFFQAAKQVLEEAGASRLQEVPDDDIDEVMDKLREVYDLYVRENEDAEIV